MKKNFKSSPNNFLHKRQGKDKHFQAQMKLVYAAFSDQPKTMLMVSKETRILRANICRYVSEWKRENKIQFLKKGICPISKHCAGFYSTNPILFHAVVKPLNINTHEQ